MTENSALDHTRSSQTVTPIQAAAVQATSDYPLGGTQVELQRLLKQATDYDSQARVLLDRLGVQRGWTVADIGCGPLGILHLLSERVGPEGRVVGVEREHRFVEAARSEIVRRGLKNVVVVEADALSTALEKASFDLVHERLVTINVSAREAFIAELMSLVRPGGTLVLEDIDSVSWLCQPPHPSWDALITAFQTAFKGGGGDPFVGRRLPELLRGAGAESIEVAMHVDTVLPGDYRRTHLLSLIESIRDKVIAQGLLSDEDLKRHRDTLRAHLDDPATTVIDRLMVQAWGRKPS